MKKLFTVLFYLIAFGAVSYFLWEYLHIPKTFLISLIASLAILLILINYKSRYVRPIGIILISVHIIWLAGYFIPVYNDSPDIRQRYRRNPSTVRALPSATSGLVITLGSNQQQQTFLGPSLNTPKPIYQGNSISTAGPSLTSDERIILGLREGSNIQLFPQSSLLIESLAPDFASLTGSVVGIKLDAGVISMATRIKNITPSRWYVHAGDIYFSCRECILAYSGNRGTIASYQPLIWWTTNGEKTTISGGTYTFSRNSISASSGSSLMSLFGDTHSTTISYKDQYDNTQQMFIKDRRGWAMDKSYILSWLSKTKMAIVGLFDWTYRTKYNNLMLYEYLTHKSSTLPPPFEVDKHLYEFIE